MISLRNIGPNEWETWKHQRLAALANAPHAFSSKFEDWENAPEQRWRDRLSICGGYQVVASLQDMIVGMAAGVLLDEPETVELVSMWVSPASRGRGVGDALVAAVEKWAYGSGATTLKLSVVKDNHSARKLYIRNGFVDVELKSGDMEINGERVMLKKKQ
ncbi:Acyl-CoA N-acyltransferase [Penicillium cf. griseofulvum]|uniref:Acyl-CoA N-acyltransferase n=1 Tax=Penicillium cf. griseofulvum TaxID=2972120 RepID=A0A9W9LYA9_9EURO|nr:Acyl-CoA N-acyltransferase [Penicillium cf. griseofulvum]KAJ5442863.1 Acyl-CoA N-acyltransferase [Penicillium cf. griseofulvum]KAJ5451519.1 Acyl-CoA N-acyltransferase [Penicillium cf. griseofulvum]